jgi:hypothetical protein
MAWFMQDRQSGEESPKNWDITEELRIRAFCDLGRTDFYP